MKERESGDVVETTCNPKEKENTPSEIYLRM
jgi:hypothetical protein